MKRFGRWLAAYSLPIALATLGIWCILHGVGWAYPQSRGYINDFANIIPDNEESKLQSRLLAIKEETKIQIVIVTVPSLDGKDAETYARELGNKWGVGVKGQDNGLILLIAPTEKKWFFKSGYGMEAMLPDSRLGTIGRNTFVPLYRQQKVGDAFAQSVEQMYQDIRKYQAKDTVVQVATPKASSKLPTWVILAATVGGMCLLIFISIGIYFYNKREKEAAREVGEAAVTAAVLASAPVYLAPRRARPYISPPAQKKSEEDKKSKEDDDYKPSRSSRHDDDDDYHSSSSGSSSSGSDWGSSGGGFGGGSFGGGGAGGDL